MYALSYGSLVMDQIRREFLKLAGIVTLVAPAMLSRGARSPIAPLPGAAGTVFDVRSFGAKGDGTNIDSPMINRAIEAAGAKGGTVYVPAGTYACYSLRLASAVSLYLDQGATILAADTPRDGTTSGYDSAESNAPWEAFQDFGHTPVRSQTTERRIAAIWISRHNLRHPRLIGTLQSPLK